MANATDPYCEGIGDLEYQPASGFLLASGLTDFSLWRLDGTRLTLHSNSTGSASPLISHDLHFVHATLAESDTNTVTVDWATNTGEYGSVKIAK